MDLVKFLEEKHSTMSDYSLIDNLRDLRRVQQSERSRSLAKICVAGIWNFGERLRAVALLNSPLINFVANADSDIEKGGHSVRYRKGDISEGLLESIMGQTFDLNDVTVSETDSFQYGDKSIAVMEAINEDTCFIGANNYIEQVNKKNKKGKKLNKSNVVDECVTGNGDLYVTDTFNESIVRLSPSGAASTAFSTAPLQPLGISQSTERGLLVVLMDVESEKIKPDLNSRRLVRHVTLTGDVIREYEYQEDGQTRLFALPLRVRQNGNNDICVVNRTRKPTGELVILSVSGSLRCRYNGQKLVEEFKPTDVVCDSHCNIIVNDIVNSKIHLLSPDGKFMKYLLTENELRQPWSMSLYKSKLWMGNFHGHVKVFQFNETLKNTLENFYLIL